MPKKKWQFEYDKKAYTLELEHGTILRRYSLYLNGRPLEPVENLFIGKGNRLIYEVDGLRINVIVLSNSAPLSFTYDIVVGDYSVLTGEKVKLPEEYKEEKKGCLRSIFDDFKNLIIFGMGFIFFEIVESIVGFWATIGILALIILSTILFQWYRHRQK